MQLLQLNMSIVQSSFSFHTQFHQIVPNKVKIKKMIFTFIPYQFHLIIPLQQRTTFRFKKVSQKVAKLQVTNFLARALHPIWQSWFRIFDISKISFSATNILFEHLFAASLCGPPKKLVVAYWLRNLALKCVY